MQEEDQGAVAESNRLLKRLITTHRENQILDHLKADKSATKKHTGVNKELGLARKYDIEEWIHRSVWALAEKAKNRQDFGWVDKITPEMLKGTDESSSSGSAAAAPS